MNTVQGNGAGTWHNLGGKFVGDSLTAVSWASERIDVFGIGLNNALWHNWYDGKWNKWEDLGGVCIGKPTAVSARAGRLDIFVIGLDSSIYHKVSLLEVLLHVRTEADYNSAGMGSGTTTRHWEELISMSLMRCAGTRTASMSSASRRMGS